MNIKKRNIVLCIIFSLITFGIYGLYWFVKLTNETNALATSKTASGGLAIFFTIITFGIYSIYWFYKTGAKIDEINGSGSNGIVYLILGIFGLGIVAYCLCQSELNKHANC